ncbi:MAG: PQQ-binding-like beta-propeller repeat protein [Gemmatimonadetes bacterium]|nr:PQQ-binding-like beta-propeller repeat protein [Gemmatimonadota bacterium]
MPGSLTISPLPDSVVFEDEQVRLGFVVRDTNGAEIRDHTFNIRWSVADTAVARVDHAGNLKGLRAGETWVRAQLLVVGPEITAQLPVKIVREGEVLWRVAAPAGERFTTHLGPSLSRDGMVVYVSTGSTVTLNGRLYALDARTGARLWDIELEGDLAVYPMVGPDGTIYTTGENVHAVSPEGAPLWSFDLGIGPPGTFLGQALSPSGDTLYVSGGRNVWALNARTGAVIWQWQGGQVVDLLVPPTVSADGKVLYAPRSWGSIQALDTHTGSLVWQIADPEEQPYEHNHFAHGPVPWGELLLTPLRFRFDAYRARDGASLWQSFSGNGYTEPVISREFNLLYEQTSSHGLVALTPQGEVRWRSPGRETEQAPIWSSGPLLDRNGTVYLAGWTGFVAVNTRANGVPRWRYPASESDTLAFHGAPLLTNEGLVLSFTRDTLYAFRTQRAKLETNSPWPMWRQNPQRTGVAGE